MTPRQKAFCKFYLQGHVPVRAAQAAGYSASTAERNAAQILRSPAVAAYLERKQADSVLFQHKDLSTAKARLMAVFEEDNPRLHLAALRELRQVARAFPGLFDTVACNKTESQELDDEQVMKADFHKNESLSLPHIDIPEVDPPVNFDDPDITRDQILRENARREQRNNPNAWREPLPVPGEPVLASVAGTSVQSTPSAIHALPPPAQAFIQTRLPGGRVCRAHPPNPPGSPPVLTLLSSY